MIRLIKLKPLYLYNQVLINSKNQPQMIRRLLFFSFFLLSLNIFSANIYVDQSAAPSGDGTSWATAFNDIQSAVDAAFANDIIFIAEGIYRPENVIDISIPLTIRGGYPLGGGVQNIPTHTTQIQADFISSNLLVRIFDIASDSNCLFQGIRFANYRSAIDTDSNITVDQVEFIGGTTYDIRINEIITSCAITNCLFSGNSDTSIFISIDGLDTLAVSNSIFENGTGRAIYANENCSNIFIADCELTNYNTNSAAFYLRGPNTNVLKLNAENNTLNSGPVISYSNENGTLSVKNSNFSNNTGEGSISLSVGYGSVIMEDTDFNNNIATGAFPYAMINAIQSNVIAKNCRVINNFVQGSQARIFGIRGFSVPITALIENCEFRNNTAAGIIENLFRVSGETEITITNCVLDNNALESPIYTDSNATITNNIFRNHTVTTNIFNLRGENPSNVVFENNRFYNNTNGDFQISDFGNLTSKNNTFIDNVEYKVSGIATATFTNEYFRGNSSGSDFLELGSTDASIENSIFISESPNGNHTLINSYNNVSLNITNSTLSSSNIDDTHVNVDFDDDLPSTLRNSIIWSGSNLTQSGLSGTTSNLTILYSLIKGENYVGAGNINGNDIANTPIFVDPSAFDFRMQDCSPTVNVGFNNYSNESTDLLENPRIFETTIDLGAYELQIPAVNTCTPDISPLCTNLTLPVDGDIDVAIDTNLSWTPVTDATGYIVRVGTALGSADILNETLVGSVTSYNLPSDLPDSADIYVIIIPFNSVGNAISCVSESFSTETIPDSCTSLTAPLDGAVDVSIATDISWSPVTDATGYILRIGTALGSFDLLNITLSNITTYNLPNDLPSSSDIFVSIIPFNNFGNANGCVSEIFTTETIITIPECTSINNPNDGANNVDVTTNINWDTIADADGYILTVGTTSGGNDIIDNEDVGNFTTYDFLTDLPENTEIFITIIPYNSAGNATSCTEESFTTETLIAALPFITTWETTTANQTITIPTRTSAFTYDYSIDWGDGATDTNITGNITHTFTTAGIHTIEISGTFPQIHFNGNAVDRDKILTIEQWGDIEWQALTQAFKGCSNLTITNPSIDVPNLSNVTNMSETFRDATLFNGDITAWDVSTVTNMFRLFNGAENFNQDIGNWDVSNVVTMSRLFEGARVFNQDIGNWNTSNVTSMNGMFAITDDFNQDIGNWDTSNVNSMNTMFGSTASFNQDIGAWDVGNVTNFTQMFISADAFNQDIGGWDVSQATQTLYMFQGADSFDQNLGNWNVSNITSANGMFNGITLSVANYEALLIGWNSQNLQPNVTFSGGFSTYCSQEAQDARANMITTDGWTITDGGLSASPTFDAIANLTVADTYTLPVITGTDLTGNELYYTGSNGTGTSYLIGDVIDYADFSSYPITLYVYDSTSCNDAETSFELTITASTVPNCTTISMPLDGDINVPITSDLSWNAVPGADGYRVTIGTSSGGTDIFDNINLGINTTVSLPDFPENTEIFVTIIPYNGVGDATGCTEESFTTETIATIPNCTILTSPINGATDVSISTDLSWTSIANADGYLLTVGTTSGGNDILDNEDVTVTTFDLPADLPENTEIFVTIIPYNGVGNASGCTEESFITETVNTLLAFITTWKTDNPGVSGPNQITIPTFTGETYNYDVDWGDGTSTTGETGNATHTYATPGSYTVSITGLFPRLFFDNAGDREKLLTIEQWGDNSWTSMASAFEGCTNVIGNFTDSPDLSNAASMANMFDKCRNYNSDMDDWDVSTITIMDNMFIGTNAFNGNIETWNTSNVTSMERMFANTLVFNRNIGNWNTSSLINMSQMFFGAQAFNQNINLKTGMGIPFGDAWDTSNVTDMEGAFWNANVFNSPIGDWNTSNVEDMSNMFFGASVFNQNIGSWNVTSVQFMHRMFILAPVFNQDIGGWTVDNVETFYEMFSGASAFNQDIGSWNIDNATDLNQMFANALSFNQDISGWNTSNVTNMAAMFSNAGAFDQNLGAWNVEAVTNAAVMFNFVTLSTANYDALLIGWNAQNLQPNVIFSGGFSTYCSQEAQDARANMIITDGWTITDGGLSTSPTFDAIANLTVADTYTLPVITGTDLTGNELYYTGPNGTGTSYTAGDIIAYADFPSYPITLYIYDITSCNDTEISFELTITQSTLPNCTTLTSPLNGATDVSISTDLSWTSIANADGYFLTVGTTSGGNDILDNFDVGNFTTYDLPADLPENTEILVTIIPYNGVGNATGCTEESFTTETIATIPNCTTLTLPLNGATDVSISTDLTWTAIANADGYFLTVGTTSGGNDIIDNEDVTATTYNLPADLPENTEIFVTIIPYNGVGNATGCTEESFTTDIVFPELEETKYGFSPDGNGINDFWEIKGIQNFPDNVVSIYNRWGDLVFEIKGYDNSSRVFSGQANKKTKMGAGRLPSGTYFFYIQINGSHNLKKTTGFVVLKR